MAVKDTKGALEHLSAEHRRQLEEDSGIAPEIIEERGVRTITHGRELPRVFSRRQKRRAPGMLFTVHRPNGETSDSFRPDEPDPENPGHKYEQPTKYYGGPGNVLDIHPSCRHLINDPSAAVIFVEGIKKGDAIVSAAKAAGAKVLIVVVSGVWNWLADGEPIPDMYDIPVEGRQVSIIFDSDILTNPSVQLAAQRLAEHLIQRGAAVWATYFPDQPDGSKTGADDFFAAGGTFAELRLLTRRYDSADFATIRLSRDEQLRYALEDLERRFWAQEWKGQGGHTDRDVYLKLVEAARRHGKVVKDGVRVTISRGTLLIAASIGSTRTLSKAIYRLEDAGLVCRDNEGRKPDKAGAFVLRASVNNEREKGEQVTRGSQGGGRRCLHLRAPRLRWSSRAVKPRRGLVRGTRRVRQGVPLEPRPAIKRLGKIRGAILDALDAAGGTATLQEIAEVLHRKRPRDMRRRHLPMLEDAGIVTVDGDRVHLADNWLDKLEEAREFDKEIEAEERAQRRIDHQRVAFHTRRRIKLDRAPTAAELDARRARFEAALEAQRCAREDRMRIAALEAFRAYSSGARKNLELCMAGELQNIQPLVQSVLAYHRVPVVRWERLWEEWRGPVLEAASSIAQENAPPSASPPDEAWRSHPLDCECTDCLVPEPRYARPYRKGVA